MVLRPQACRYKKGKLLFAGRALTLKIAKQIYASERPYHGIGQKRHHGDTGKCQYLTTEFAVYQ